MESVEKIESKTKTSVKLEIDYWEADFVGARVCFSQKINNTIYLSDSRHSHIKRYDTRGWKCIYLSRVEIPRVDCIIEDCYGKVWVFCLSQQISIPKFNQLLFLEETYIVPTDKSESYHDYSNVCVSNADKSKIYFPANCGEIKVLNIKKSLTESKIEKSAVIESVFISSKNHLSLIYG